MIRNLNLRVKMKNMDMIQQLLIQAQIIAPLGTCGTIYF